MFCLNPTKLVYDFNEKKYFSSPHFRFVSQVVLKLLKNNCIEELDQKYYCCNSRQNKFPYDNLTASSEILSKFLGFQWTFKDGSTKYFQFCVLPFCLSSAGYVFAKFYAYLLSVGTVSALFISMMVLQHLVVSSLPKQPINLPKTIVINVEKSGFNPKTNGKWLGTITDTIKITFIIPSEKN